MEMRNQKIQSASDVLAREQLNAAEKLRIAEKLVDDVLTDLGPCVDPVLCIAEGELRVATYAIESARDGVEDVL